MAPIARVGRMGRSRGAAVIEFALVAMLFFTALFAVFDFGYLFWVNLTMQHAVREGARVAVTGRQDLDPNPEPGNALQNRYDSALAQMQSQSMGLWSKVSPVVSTQTIDGNGNLVALGANNFGAAGNIVVITVTCTVPLLTPFTRPFFANGAYVFRVSATMRNETFT